MRGRPAGSTPAGTNLAGTTAASTGSPRVYTRLAVIVSLLVAVAIFVVILKVGIWGLKMIARPAPPPLPPGELRKINIRYRCSVCGMEMRTMLSPDEEPDPPRHCMEEMDVVRPLD
ncbi:MAG: hypothetical protein NVS3B12_09900 [Acidimicrobiales bacterium]